MVRQFLIGDIVPSLTRHKSQLPKATRGRKQTLNQSLQSYDMTAATVVPAAVQPRTGPCLAVPAVEAVVTAFRMLSPLRDVGA